MATTTWVCNCLVYVVDGPSICTIHIKSMSYTNGALEHGWANMVAISHLVYYQCMCLFSFLVKRSCDVWKMHDISAPCKLSMDTEEVHVILSGFIYEGLNSSRKE